MLHDQTEELSAMRRLQLAAPRDRIEYHRGAHLEGTELVNYARYLHDNGVVDLVQKRNGKGDFSYIAIVRDIPVVIKRNQFLGTL